MRPTAFCSASRTRESRVVPWTSARKSAAKAWLYMRELCAEMKPFSRVLASTNSSPRSTFRPYGPRPGVLPPAMKARHARAVTPTWWPGVPS